jgi:hypothetical protein
MPHQAVGSWGSGLGGNAVKVIIEVIAIGAPSFALATETVGA